MGGPSSPPTFVWCPGTPGYPMVTIIDSSGVRLVWSGTRDQAANLINAYILHITHHDSNDGEDHAESSQLVHTEEASPDVDSNCPDMVSSLITGLRSGQTYSFRVQAAEGDEPRPISEESDCICLPCFAPLPPGPCRGCYHWRCAAGMGACRIRR